MFHEKSQYSRGYRKKNFVLTALVKYRLGWVLVLSIHSVSRNRKEKTSKENSGWIILSCYKLQEYCLYAWMLLSISGFTMLISNYTSMNYYMPKLIGTSITLLCGVFDASASMGKILGVIYDAGASLESIFITMAVLSLLTILKSFLLHPYKTIPKVSNQL